MNTYPLLSIDHLTEHTFKMRIKRPDISIRSGQCFNIGVPLLGINREYSMYSSADSDYLDFLIRAVDGGIISSELQKLKPGDLVEVDGAYGEFCLNDPTSNNQDYLFIATGTGIAPFHSFIQTWQSLDYIILHGVRTEDECYDINDYEPNSYIPCLSNPGGDKDISRVTDYLSTLELSSSVKVYICGNRNMIVDVFEILHSKGVSGDRIITEVFF
jgi:ferredoxin/flavodoxin---NADP+ reductase